VCVCVCFFFLFFLVFVGRAFFLLSIIFVMGFWNLKNMLGCGGGLICSYVNSHDLNSKSECPFFFLWHNQVYDPFVAHLVHAFELCYV